MTNASPKLMFWCLMASIVNKLTMYIHAKIDLLCGGDPDEAWEIFFDGHEEER